mgnify:CR=1
MAAAAALVVGSVLQHDDPANHQLSRCSAKAEPPATLHPDARQRQSLPSDDGMQRLALDLAHLIA